MADAVPIETLRESLAAAAREVPPLSVWRHRSGALYVVTGLAVREDDLVVLVLYSPWSEGLLAATVGPRVDFARPLSEWRVRFLRVTFTTPTEVHDG